MLILRPLTAADNAAAAAVIRTVMPEFGCVGPGYSIEDPEMDDLFGTYSRARSGFYVLVNSTALSASRPAPASEQNSGAAAGAWTVEAGLRPALEQRGEENASHVPPGTIVGVGGYAPLAGTDGDICELRKMYLLPAARGYGGGRLIMNRCLAGARADGFTTMYLETVTAMTDAARIYRKYGFEYIDGPLGATGHSGCDLFMTRPL